LLGFALFGVELQVLDGGEHVALLHLHALAGLQRLQDAAFHALDLLHPARRDHRALGVDRDVEGGEAHPGKQQHEEQRGGGEQDQHRLARAAVEVRVAADGFGLRWGAGWVSSGASCCGLPRR
jgi:hypothetical protein